MWSYNSELCLFVCVCAFLSNQFYTSVVVTHMDSIQNILLWCVCVCVLSRRLLQHKFIWFTSGFVSCMICTYTIGKIIYSMPSSPALISFFLPALPLPRHCSDNICCLNFMFSNLFRSFHFLVSFGTALTYSVCVSNILFILWPVWNNFITKPGKKKIDIFLISHFKSDVSRMSILLLLFSLGKRETWACLNHVLLCLQLKFREDFFLSRGLKMMHFRLV